MIALHLVKTSTGAGWALRQMRQLVNLGIEVHVAMPTNGPLVHDYHVAGVIVHPYQFDLPLKQPTAMQQRFSQLRHLVDAIGPDIIHSHFVGTTLTMRLALGRNHPIPRVFQVPGPLHLEHRFFRIAELSTAGASDFWIGSCEWTCSTYRQAGVAADRVFLSYYGGDLNRFRNTNQGKLRNELGIGGDTAIVGMVAFMYAPKRYLGQTRGIKGHEDLIDALAICRQGNLNVFGVFIGGAWANARAYERRVREYGRRVCGENVVFLGTRQDVPDLYPGFDVAVHPSHSENLGGAGESLLMAVPTIATNVGGFPDIVIPGRTGWLVPPRSPEALASAIKDVINDPRGAKRLADNGRSLCRQLLDVERTAFEIPGIYQQILNKKRQEQQTPTN